VPPENIITDPGIGFGKTWQQELGVIDRLGELRALGKPVLLGTSRKSFIARVLDEPTEGRLEGTAASVVVGIVRGADIVRVHDVKEMVRICRVADAIIRRSP
jgi:dihydropteroate synthase